ncbi:BgTH12-01556 [Blumeria graminis f. sp. triticale]|uniref:Ribosome assembly protein 3 n=3 Tax=Blumeria graminis TaxID=34373 RepID=A0A381L8D0_BLUGR|nr:hypothetical protein BGT96224_301 [Blumeria graminis f. sp. tritici 96224]CAD6501304.1 BgTH12-01556 [Blumeria graminis f. sp. triticale]VDB83744.1 Bgt-301 [Blumeria graminis f. sp. tritici]
MPSESHIQGKSKRHKKRKSRTEVSTDDSESELETVNHIAKDQNDEKSNLAIENHATDTEVSSTFAKIFMTKVAEELSDDLDELRKADDFKDDALPILINALQQGTSLFSRDEQRRIVLAESNK